MSSGLLRGLAVLAVLATGCDALSPPPGQGIVALARVDFILSFSQGIGFFFPSGSKPETVGPCRFRRVTATATDGGMTPSLASAGTLTFGGLEMPLVLSPGANNGYSGDVKGRSPDAGTRLSITAGGATVPAFTSTVTMPARTASKAPSKLERGVAATVTFTPLTGGSQLRLFVLGQSGLLDCSFDGSSGTATIPAAALDGFSVGDQVILVPAAVDSSRVSVPGWEIETLAAYADDYARGTL